MESHPGLIGLSDKGPLDRVEQGDTVNRFVKEGGRVHLAGIEFGGRIVIGGDNDQGHCYSLPFELIGELFKRRARHPDIHDHAAGEGWFYTLEKLIPGRERLDPVTGGFQEPGQALAGGGVVIDDKDFFLFLHRRQISKRGKEILCHFSGILNTSSARPAEEVFNIFELLT